MTEAVKHPTEKWTYYLRKYLPVITNNLLDIRVNTNVSLTKPLQYLKIKKTYIQINNKQPGNWYDKTVKNNYDIMIRERKIKKIRNVIATDNLSLSLQNVWDPKLAYLYSDMNFKIFDGVYYGGIAWNKSGQCPMCNRLYDTTEHLFVRCGATKGIRQELAMRLGIQSKQNKLYTLLAGPGQPSRTFPGG